MKRKIILGTDWWTDCDDCVAVRVLTRAHHAGEIEFVGAVMNAAMPLAAASLNAFLTADGLPDLPLGIDHEANDFHGTHFTYQEPLCRFAHTVHCNEDCMDGVALYRKILSESTEKVDIVEIGFFQVIANLLRSSGGVELVREKVGHIYAMAGKWDEDGGLEHNFCNNARSREAAHTFCALCPVPVTFLGFEVGESVLTGDGLPQDDVLSVAVQSHGHGNGRSSWDPMTAVLAICGDAEKAGYETVKGTASVDADTGANHFRVHPDGLHEFVRKKHPDSFYRDAIQQRIQ